MSHRITLVFADGVAHSLAAPRGERILEVARRNGLSLLVDCEEGRCGTCTASLLSGAVELSDYDPQVLPDAERSRGGTLVCRACVTGPAVIELPYDSDQASSAGADSVAGRVRSVRAVAADVIELTVELGACLDFLPGQYVRLAPSERQVERAYSMASAPGTGLLTFYAGLVPGGKFSGWLATAAPGEELRVSAPRGAFFLRSGAQPKVFIAGGTGLAPFLSMLAAMPRGSERVDLLIGARRADQLFGRLRLEELERSVPALRVHTIVEEKAGDLPTGRVTDLFCALELSRQTRIYACGPPPMVEAVKQSMALKGFEAKQLLSEKFFSQP